MLEKKERNGCYQNIIFCLNMYNTCLFVNYTLIKLKKELKEKACEWLNKWYYHGTFILTSHWNMQQLAWMHFHRDKLFTKGYISYDSMCETLLKWQNYRNGTSLAVSPRLSVGWGGWNVSVEKGQHDGPLVMGRPISWHPGSHVVL